MMQASYPKKSSNLDYSDDTPDVDFAYDRLSGGRLRHSPPESAPIFTTTACLESSPTKPLPGATNFLRRVYYNDRSEVISATIQSGHTNHYAYDSIGNNLWTSLNYATNTYTANALNQYTNIANNSTIALEYDPDGNLVWDGRFNYSWDAENRLTSVYSNAICVVSNAYDHQSRRVLKITPTATHAFIYDRWNLIHETIQNQQLAITNQYVWGKDLSGTLQGAGGVGGLLAVSIDGSWNFPLYDHNGNIMTYVSKQGAIDAEYIYDAFGRTIAQSGPMADIFSFRFSTKYHDSETGLYCYGERYYSPELIRWPNRDSIGEEGGLSLYGFCGNDALNGIDPLGEARLGNWIEPGLKDGWSIIGTGRFPGPGWSGEFRGRPATLFDFTAKLHDLNYVLNDIKFGVVSGTIGHGVSLLRGRAKALSRKAKADFIFRKMNEVGTGAGGWVGFVNWAARAVFYDDPKYFCKGDDFANALRQPETPRLANPGEYLMIPFSHLKDPRYITVVKHWKGIPNHPRSKIFSYPNYMERSDDDIHPGWWAWAESVYGRTWKKIQEITDETDFSFKW